MVNTDGEDGAAASVRGLADDPGWKPAHADIRQRFMHLKDSLRVPWKPMTPEQRAAAQSHPGILAHANPEDSPMEMPWAASPPRPSPRRPSPPRPSPAAPSLAVGTALLGSFDASRGVDQERGCG